MDMELNLQMNQENQLKVINLVTLFFFTVNQLLRKTTELLMICLVILGILQKLKIKMT